MREGRRQRTDDAHGLDAGAHHLTHEADDRLRVVLAVGVGLDAAAFVFGDAGELARLHVEYETLEPWPLEWVENPAYPLSYRVEDKMRLNKDKTALA